MQTKSFKGKVALVTGGSRGIGAGIVRRLAADGASVAFTYSSSPEKALELVREIESAGGQALSLKATAARPKSCGPLWPELQKPSALLTSSSATRAFSPGAQSTRMHSKTSTAWWPSTSVSPSSVFRQPPKK